MRMVAFELQMLWIENGKMKTIPKKRMIVIFFFLDQQVFVDEIAHFENEVWIANYIRFDDEIVFRLKKNQIRAKIAWKNMFVRVNGTWIINFAYSSKQKIVAVRHSVAHLVHTRAIWFVIL